MIGVCICILIICIKVKRTSSTHRNHRSVRIPVEEDEAFRWFIIILFFTAKCSNKYLWKSKRITLFNFYILGMNAQLFKAASCFMLSLIYSAFLSFKALFFTIISINPHPSWVRNCFIGSDVSKFRISYSIKLILSLSPLSLKSKLLFIKPTVVIYVGNPLSSLILS